eukprot:9079828-Lingulodinium_polyedra.AAC.1
MKPTLVKDVNSQASIGPVGALPKASPCTSHPLSGPGLQMVMGSGPQRPPFFWPFVSGRLRSF